MLWYCIRGCRGGLEMTNAEMQCTPHGNRPSRLIDQVCLTNPHQHTIKIYDSENVASCVRYSKQKPP